MGRYRVRSGDLNIAGVLLLACAALLLSAVAVYVVVRGMSPVPAQGAGAASGPHSSQRPNLGDNPLLLSSPRAGAARTASWARSRSRGAPTSSMEAVAAEAHALAERSTAAVERDAASQAAKQQEASPPEADAEDEEPSASQGHLLDACPALIKAHTATNSPAPAASAHQARRLQLQMCMGAPRPWYPTLRTNGSLTDMEGFENEAETFRKRRHRSLLGIADKSTLLRRNYCSGKPSAPSQDAGEVSDQQLLLACCLRKSAMGKPCPVDAVTLQEAALSLPGMKMLRRRVPCHRVTAKGECSTLEGNPESAVQGSLPSSRRPTVDWQCVPVYTAARGLLSFSHMNSEETSDHAAVSLQVTVRTGRVRGGLYKYREKQWKTCAIVGRSPAVKIEQNGKAIDAHQAVWRFNLASTAGISAYTGSRTTARIVNNADAHRARDGMAGTSEQATFKSDGTSNEEWIFWQYASVRFMGAIQDKFQVAVNLLAPKFVKWQMDAYFAIKRDLEQLGLGPFECPTSVSSGTHAMFIGVQLCEKVDMFGFSYYNKMFTSKEGHNNGPQKMYRGHSWRLDMTMLRLFAFANKVSICTADNPNVTMAQLQKRGFGSARGKR